MAFTFIFIVLCFPLIALCIYNIAFPEESLIFRDRWKYNNPDLEPSEAAVKHIRFMAILRLVLIGLFMIFSLFIK